MPDPRSGGFIDTDDGSDIAGRAARRRELVPGQRPPDRQGRLHVPGDRPQGPRGGRQRQLAEAPTNQRQRRPGPGTRRARWRPTWPRSTSASSSYAPTARRAPLLRRRRPRPLRARRAPSTGRNSRSPSGRLRVQAADPDDHVPASGGQLSFRVTRDTEPDWDFFFVEAHTVGRTTGRRCPTLNGHTGPTPATVPVWLGPAPVPRALPDRRRRRNVRAPGSTGAWYAATGQQRRLEQWQSTYRVRRPQSRSPSAMPATTSCSSAASSSTTSPSPPARAPRRSRPTATSWTAGVPGRRRAARATPTTGSSAPPRRHAAGRGLDGVARAGARDLAFLPSYFGRYPLRSVGGIVDDVPTARVRAGDPDPAGLLPARSSGPADATASSSTSSPTSGPATPRVARWQRHLAQRRLRDLRRVAVVRARGPGDAPRGSSTASTVHPGRATRSGLHHRRPRPDHLFDYAGLLARRHDPARAAPAVGDDDFFRILRRWAPHRDGDNVTIPAVHPARRARLRPAPAMAVPELALHGRKARRSRPPPRLAPARVRSPSRGRRAGLGGWPSTTRHGDDRHDGPPPAGRGALGWLSGSDARSSVWAPRWALAARYRSFAGDRCTPVGTRVATVTPSRSSWTALSGLLFEQVDVRLAEGVQHPGPPTV